MTVARLERYKLGDIPACLRLLADQIESGSVDAVRMAIVFETSAAGVDYRAFGSEPYTSFHFIGLLDGGKMAFIDNE